MKIDEILETVEQNLLDRQLTQIERFILHQSWLGQSYGDIARSSAYCDAHIKEIGSQLWQELSGALGEKVTKKNLQIVWERYRKNSTGEQVSTAVISGKIASIKDVFPGVLERIEFPDGPVALDSPLYIDRPPIEELAFAEISRPGCVIRIKAPRKMGKTSLLNRIVARGKKQGYKTVFLDFQEADETIFVSLDKFLRWFCTNISKQLDLNPMLDEYWDEDMGSKTSCKIYFQDYVLERIESPAILALNEVNRIFEHPKIARDFLPMLRLWHELARVEENWRKLRLAIVHATEIYVPLKLNQSPFNVGLSLTLPQLNFEQMQDLAQRYGLNWTDGKSTQKLMAMVGGHPYLANVAFYYLSRGEVTLEELLQTAPTLSGIYGHHLRGMLEILRQDAELMTALQQVFMASGSIELEAIAAYKLESLGLVRLEGNRAKVSCDLYGLYFNKQLFRSDDRTRFNSAPLPTLAGFI